ncbi:hypothetical protein [Rhodoferax saidenbachensis]|uniref:NAD(P)-binding domain-containing protein n=1 Tax=Rhodoferax saidenbachensis TaxID=1484693 RepID=A0ABU1ZMQ2_9BURK|nr:hypothetical protein [Rhodoferax saidenbachensis]MDR7306817.1 hypothetical protein [Rhodoferax saidenbachensis]
MNPLDVLHAAQRGPTPPAALPVALMAGAAGTLGTEVLRRLAGSHHYRQLRVLSQEDITPALDRVQMVTVVSDDPSAWPLQPASVGVIVFDAPSLYNDRERALWTPQPAQLPALAAWMLRCGVHTLAVVVPHDQGRLPQALKAGLANLDEHAVATMGFERLLLVRPAAAPQSPLHANVLEWLAHRMLSIFAYMVPSNEMPPRAADLAALVDVALREMPPGVHIAPPELARRTSEATVQDVVRAWLAT